MGTNLTKEEKMVKIVLVITLCWFGIGCAKVDVKTLTPEEDNRDEGIRYYERAPFLLVYSDGKGGLVTKVKYLPDRKKLRSIHSMNFMANNKNTWNFKNGMLVDSINVSDATTVPKAVIKAVETVASKAAGMGMFFTSSAKEGYVLPPPALYRIYINGGIVRFVGGAGTDPEGKPMVIEFTLKTQEEAKK